MTEQDPKHSLSVPGASATQPLSHVDRAWLRMDEPESLMVINGLMMFEETLDHDRLTALIKERFLAIPRFRQRVVGASGPGKTLWEDHAEFRLDHHLENRGLDGANEEQLKTWVSEEISKPLNPSRPLWQVQHLTGLASGSALLVRIHHCVADGVALMVVLLSLTDLEADPVVEPGGESGSRNPFTRLFAQGSEHAAQARAYGERMMPEGMKLMTKPASSGKKCGSGRSGGAGRLVVKGAASAGRLVFRRADPKTVFKGPLGVAKRVAWSEGMELAQVKQLKTALGGTINDLLMSAMAGGLRRYLLGRGEAVEGLEFRAAVPVNLRTLEKMADLGNRFGLVFVSLPVGIADPRERLAEMRRRTAELKGSPEPVLVYGLLKGAGMSPSAIQRLLVRIFGTKATAVLTNVPGPQEAVFLAGSKLSSLMFWVPQSGRLGLGISILSYAGTVRLGVVSDAGMVPDPQGIIDGFQQEMAEMLRLAQQQG